MDTTERADHCYIPYWQVDHNQGLSISIDIALSSYIYPISKATLSIIWGAPYLTDKVTFSHICNFLLCPKIRPSCRQFEHTPLPWNQQSHNSSTCPDSTVQTLSTLLSTIASCAPLMFDDHIFPGAVSCRSSTSRSSVKAISLSCLSTRQHMPKTPRRIRSYSRYSDLAAFLVYVKCTRHHSIHIMEHAKILNLCRSFYTYQF
jgi:hypothetical protein